MQFNWRNFSSICIQCYKLTTFSTQKECEWSILITSFLNSSYNRDDGRTKFTCTSQCVGLTFVFLASTIGKRSAFFTSALFDCIAVCPSGKHVRTLDVFHTALADTERRCKTLYISWVGNLLRPISASYHATAVCSLNPKS